MVCEILHRQESVMPTTSRVLKPIGSAPKPNTPPYLLVGGHNTTLIIIRVVYNNHFTFSHSTARSSIPIVIVGGSM